MRLCKQCVRRCLCWYPGWLYKSNKDTGADLAQLQQGLMSEGYESQKVDTGENDTVMENARVIATTLRAHAKTNRPIVVVSASKGGAETLAALEQIHASDPDFTVKAWINIGGLLRGTALANVALRWPVCAWVKWFVVPDGRMDAIESMRPVEARILTAHSPALARTMVINVVAVPMAADIKGDAALGYAILGKHGPNDGITLATDAVVSDGLTIPVIGADHYFRTDLARSTLKWLVRAVSSMKLVEVRAWEPEGGFLSSIPHAAVSISPP